jgi:hypothetical protein
MAAYLSNSRGFLKIWYAWAAISLACLLAVRLGWRPFGGTDPGWEALKGWHSLLMILGMIGWFTAAGIWFYWLRRNVPLAPRRSATLRPRTAAEYLSLPWRVAVETLTVLNLAAWVYVGIAYPNLLPNHWGRFASWVAVTALVAAIAWYVPRRRPSYPDRLFGDAYRRVEIRAAYVIRLAPVAAGAMTLGEAFTGVDYDRYGQLLVALVVNGLLAAFVFMRPAAPTASEPPAASGPGGMISSSFGSTMQRSPSAL